MCQAKSQGGKRCAIHHHGTQAAVQTTVVKTGVETPEVKQVFSELNKEGKKLDAPSREEYISYIEKERFITNFDPSIPERERKMIINKLEKAKEENTPSGGTFHAWKNLMSKTIEKYGKKIRMAFGVIGIGTVVAFTGGCSAGITNGDLTTPSSSSISQTTGQIYGSVIDGELVKDENGSYIRTTINPEDPSYKTLISNVDPALYANGYTEEDVLSAQRFVAKFQAEEYSDSIALTGSGWEKWKQEVAPKYISEADIQEILSNSSDGSRSYIIFNNPKDKKYSIIQDGRARISNNNITISEIKNFVYEGKNYVVVKGVSETTYRIPKAQALQAYKDVNPGLTEEQIIAKTPSLAEDVKEGAWINTGNFSYTLEKKEDSWQIVGYTNNSSAVIK